MTDLELKRYMDEGIVEKEAREIEKMVWTSFPRSKKEREGCVTEKANRDELRNIRRKRLIKETKEKREFGQK